MEAGNLSEISVPDVLERKFVITSSCVSRRCKDR